MISFYESDWPIVYRNLQIYQRKWFLNTVLLYVVPIGCLQKNLWEVLLGVGSVCASLWVIFVCYQTPHNAGAGKSPYLGGAISFCLDVLVLERTLGVPPIGEALSDVGLDTIGGYISQRHISEAQYIATRPIFYLEVVEENQTRSRKPYFCGNKREYGSEMMVGVHMSHRWSRNNITVLINIQY